MIKRKISIVFHIGNGKTGTTFLQQHAPKAKYTYFVGKTTDSRFIDPEIDQIHYRIFPSYRGENISSYPNPTRNSHELVTRYANAIAEIAKNNIDARTIIISDECIGDYYNYLGELNSFLAIAIGNSASKLLSEIICVNKVLSVTCRNQVDIIKSFIGYSWTMSRDIPIDKLVKSLLSDPSYSYAGSLFYAKRFDLYSTIGNDWKIKLVPYEILSNDKNPVRYLSETYSLDDEQLSTIKAEDLEKKVNVNSGYKNGELRSLMRTESMLKRLGFKLTSKYIHSLKISILNQNRKSMYSYGLCYGIGKLLEYISNIIPHTAYSKKVIMSKEVIQLIKATYRQDNKKLQKVLRNHDLKYYGYFD